MATRNRILATWIRIGLTHALACIAVTAFTIAAAEEIDIFTGDRIGFASGQSREIQQTVTFPEFGTNDQLTLNWDVLGDADPWDRAGSIHVMLPSGEEIQLGKFITGFNGTTTHSQDISRLAPLLSGQSLTVEAHIDTWVANAWRINASIDVQSDANPETNPAWAAPAFSRDPSFGWHNSGLQTKSSEVDVPEGLDSVTLAYFASGHHHTQTGNSDEFNRRRHRLFIDGVQVWTGIPWRTDGPNFRDVNPTSGRFDGNSDGDTTDPYPIDVWSSDFPRSGWVPGDEVAPYLIDVTEYIEPGRTHDVELTIAGVDINSYWRVSAYLSGTSAVAVSQPGDYDDDDDVDGRDFLIWQRGGGDSSGLTTWQQNYGAVRSPGELAVVPEPSTLAIAILGVGALGCVLKRRQT